MPQEFDPTPLADISGFFALKTGEPPAGLSPLAEAYALSGSAADPFAVRVRRVAAGTGAPQERVAASLAHLGLASRLWSVALGSGALYGVVPDLDPSLLHWDPAGATGEDLWLRTVRLLPADAATLDRLVREVHLVALSDAVHARYRLAHGLLQGNAASALAGALRETARWALCTENTAAGEWTRGTGDALFAVEQLASAGVRRGQTFTRRSCCLYYRVPGGGVCGDCCFTVPPGRAPRTRGREV